MTSTNKKTVLITGCSEGGIGFALAKEFHEQGLRVFATARRMETMKQLEALGIETLQLDVTSEESIVSVHDEISQRTGGSLDILVNNAGQAYSVPCTDFVMSEVRNLFEVNLFAVMVMVQKFIKLILASPNGKIVNIGSIAGVMPYPFGSAYNASKAALHSFGDNLRVELRPFNIDVVTVVTGGITSNITRNHRHISESSIFAPIILEHAERRMGRSQRGAMPATDYAKKLVNQVLKKRLPAWYWLGTFSLQCWFISTFLPKKTFDFLFSIAFGLNILAKKLGRRKVGFLGM